MQTLNNSSLLKQKQTKKLKQIKKNDLNSMLSRKGKDFALRKLFF